MHQTLMTDEIFGKIEDPENADNADDNYNEDYGVHTIANAKNEDDDDYKEDEENEF